MLLLRRARASSLRLLGPKILAQEFFHAVVVVESILIAIEAVTFSAYWTQRLGNRLIHLPTAVSAYSGGVLRCSRLGGTLSFYYRDAA